MASECLGNSALPVGDYTYITELLNGYRITRLGGGEGRASGGHPRSRTGLYAKGLKTRAPKKQSSKYIIERRK